ncbi:unnamed protein product [Cladocopium goreaui]|uniref:Uncharacterized protein n=1 Tax=Cladocopium goreaui TaxID=2562237 RepID=A0A9P1CIC2_9DINO|nr:unnamed protein product [Cladocopium goreaui]
MLAGQILKYCFDKADQVLAAQAPCIYKFGYTHCAHFRWHNTTFGYKCAPDKWEKLLVIYAASETISPAYVEGALIQRFKGASGCRNIRDGGETIQSHLDGPYLVYLVWRSFKRPPQ